MLQHLDTCCEQLTTHSNNSKDDNVKNDVDVEKNSLEAKPFPPSHSRGYVPSTSVDKISMVNKLRDSVGEG